MTLSPNAPAPESNAEAFVDTHRNRVPMLILTVAVAGGLLAALFRVTTVSSQIHSLYAPVFGLVPGVWTTLASDLANGVFYRPVLGSDGYGGTRYMPLHFILHAVLMKVGLSAWTTQCVLVAFGLLCLLTGVFALLQQMKAGRAMSWLGTLLILASSTTQSIMTNLQIDMLSAACNVWGLFFCVRFLSADDKRMHLIQKAALCFVLAFVTKLSMIFGLVAALLAFHRAGQKRAALHLALWTCGGIMLCLALIHVSSQGRFLENLLTCASSGSSWGSVARAPLFWLETLLREDPFGLFVIFFAFSVFVALPGTARREIIPTALPITAAIIIFLYGSPGVNQNLNLDLFVISVILLVGTCNRHLSFSLVATHLAFLTFFGVWTSVRDTRNAAHFFREVHPQSVELTAPSLRQLLFDSETVRPNAGPILSQSPWIPILMNERPYLLDPFMLRVAGMKHPRVAQDFENKMKAHFFSVIILYSDPTTEAGRAMLTDVFFAPNFDQLLSENYELKKRTGVGLVFYPRLKKS